MCLQQSRNQGGRNPLEKIFPPLEKCVGHNFKLLDTVQNIWAPLRKLFAPPGVTSWLRAWFAERETQQNGAVTRM